MPSLVSVLSVSLVALVVVGAPTEAPVATPVSAVAELPKLLSKTGFFQDVAGNVLSERFQRYEVNVPAWADGASKERFFRLPPNRKARFRSRGAWEFPEGTVFLQTVILPLDEARRRVETRVIRKESSGLTFATYVWRPDQKDADLTRRGRKIDIDWEGGYQLWEVTPVSRCDECHDPDTQSLLGLSTKQLNRTVRGVNQMSDFAKRGLVTGVPEDVSRLTRLANPHDKKAPLARRARSYLDANCSVCHRPGGNGSGRMDLRFETPVKDTGLGPDHEVLMKGDPFSSWIYLRMIYTDRRQMPNLLTTLVDEKGADLIHDWVTSLEGK